MRHDNEFWCYACKAWRPYDDWIASRSLGDSEADYCSNCVRKPAEDNLVEFNDLVNDLKRG